MDSSTAILNSLFAVLVMACEAFDSNLEVVERASVEPESCCCRYMAAKASECYIDFFCNNPDFEVGYFDAK